MSNKHEIARICRGCCSKVGKIVLRNNHLQNSKLGKLFTQYFEEIDVLDENRPNVVCNTCKLYLYSISSGITTRKIPTRFDWPTIRNTRLNTCRDEKLCSMCIKSRRLGRNNQAPFSLIHKRSGIPIVNSPQKIIKTSSSINSDKQKLKKIIEF